MALNSLRLFALERRFFFSRGSSLSATAFFFFKAGRPCYFAGSPLPPVPPAHSATHLLAFAPYDLAFFATLILPLLSFLHQTSRYILVSALSDATSKVFVVPVSRLSRLPPSPLLRVPRRRAEKVHCETGNGF